jgi:hypothetical protein
MNFRFPTNIRLICKQFDIIVNLVPLHREGKEKSSQFRVMLHRVNSVWSEGSLFEDSPLGIVRFPLLSVAVVSRRPILPFVLPNACIAAPTSREKLYSSHAHQVSDSALCE